MQASMEFKLPAQVRKQGKWFISSCNLLDVHSQGHTREQAERNLKDALATFYSVVTSAAPSKSYCARR